MAKKLLQNQFEESLDRLITYMGWSDDNPSHLDETSGKNKCYDAFANRTPANTNEHPDTEPRVPRNGKLYENAMNTILICITTQYHCFKNKKK